MKLEVGRIYVSRGGMKVFVSRKNPLSYNSQFQVYCLKLGEGPYCVNPNGKSWGDFESYLDLIGRDPDCKNVKNFQLK